LVFPFRLCRKRQRQWIQTTNHHGLDAGFLICPWTSSDLLVRKSQTSFYLAERKTHSQNLHDDNDDKDDNHNNDDDDDKDDNNNEDINENNNNKNSTTNIIVDNN
jgi:hypothetical protein